MEKINKEELMKKLNLTEEELMKVTGGLIEYSSFKECVESCEKSHATEKSSKKVDCDAYCNSICK